MSLYTDEFTNAFVKNMVKSLTDFQVGSNTNICNGDYDEYVECLRDERDKRAVVNLTINNIPTDKKKRTILSDFKEASVTGPLLQSIIIDDKNGVIQDTLKDLLTQSFPTLYTIDIKSKGVTGSLPKEINANKLRNLTIHGSLSKDVSFFGASVEYMDLAGNQLDAFDAITFLKLTHVNLSRNKITDFTNFWGTSESSKKYVTVDISGNKGTKEFPTSFNTPDLIFLNVSGSDFYLTDNLALPESLKTFDASNNGLTGSVPLLPNAELINASRNGFTTLADEYSEVMPKVIRLDLSSNPNLEGSLSIGKKTTPSLKEFSVANTKLETTIASDVDSLEMEVINVSNVKSVQFTDLPEGVALPRFPSTLRVLDLTNAGLNGTIPEDAFKDCDQLERVALSGNHIEGCVPASWRGKNILQPTDVLETLEYCEVKADSARSGSNGKTIGIAVGCSVGGVLLLVLLLVVLCCCCRSCCLTQCLIRFWNKVCCCCRCGVKETSNGAVSPSSSQSCISVTYSDVSNMFSSTTGGEDDSWEGVENNQRGIDFYVDNIGGRSVHRMATDYVREDESAEPHGGDVQPEVLPGGSVLSTSAIREGENAPSFGSLLRLHSIPSISENEEPSTPIPAPLVRIPEYIVHYPSEDYEGMLQTATESTYNQSMKNQNLAVSNLSKGKGELPKVMPSSNEEVIHLRATDPDFDKYTFLTLNHNPPIEELQEAIPPGKTWCIEKVCGDPSFYATNRNGEVFFSVFEHTPQPPPRTRYHPPPSSHPPAPANGKGFRVPFVPIHPVPSPQPPSTPAQPVIPRGHWSGNETASERRERQLKSMACLNPVSFDNIPWVDVKLPEKPFTEL